MSIIETLHRTWIALEPKAKSAFKVLLIFQIVTSVALIVPLERLVAFAETLAIDDFDLWFNIARGLLLFLIILGVVTIMLIVRVHRVIKQSYLARMHPGVENPEQGNWAGLDGLLLYLGIGWASTFLLNIASLIRGLITGAQMSDIILVMVAIVLTVIVVPLCCKKYVLAGRDDRVLTA